jgi:hypothetical protein
MCSCKTFLFTFSAAVTHICVVIEPGQVANTLYVSPIRHIFFVPRLKWQYTFAWLSNPFPLPGARSRSFVGTSIDLLLQPIPSRLPRSEFPPGCLTGAVQRSSLPLLPIRRGQARSRSGSTLRSQQGHLQRTWTRVAHGKQGLTPTSS